MSDAKNVSVELLYIKPNIDNDIIPHIDIITRFALSSFFPGFPMIANNPQIRKHKKIKMPLSCKPFDVSSMGKRDVFCQGINREIIPQVEKSSTDFLWLLSA